MRLFLLLILTLFGQSSFAQWKQDTTISKKMLDSLYQELARYKDANKQTYFNGLVTTYTVRVDSIFSIAKDTLTIFNYTRTNRPLLKQEIRFDKTGCKRRQYDTYFDTTGRRQYEEQWHMSCNPESSITGFLQYRYRYHYDRSGNEIGMTMESYDGAGHRVQRFWFTIGPDGKSVWKDRVTLNKFAFWD
jgi:hypothetical protein